MNNLNTATTVEQHNSRFSDGGSNYESATALAGKAIRLAETHKTPPIPKTYEVWYSYAEGSDKSINRSIDSIIEKGKVLDDHQIDQIYCDHLCSKEKEIRQHDTTNLKLEQEMGEVIKLIQSHVATSKNYSGSLNQTVKSLSDTATPKQIRKTIELLIEENSRMRSESANLTQNLKRSKQQVSKMRQSLAESRQKAMRDQLTGLSNRRHFDISLAKEITKSLAGSSPMCLAMVDIDHFKKINDTFGHLVGDQVLKFFGQLLSKNVKGRDIVSRYGGEEFAIILPSTDIANARILAKNIRSQIAETSLVVTKNRKSIGMITASFGLSQVVHNDTPETLIQRADTKLYQAKNAGRNRVC